MTAVARRQRTSRPASIPMGRLIHDVARLRRKLLDTEMQPAGLTRSQWSVLNCLANQDAGTLMQSDLAKALEIGKVTLGGLVDRLEAKGFLKREADPTDRRVKRLALTSKGRRAVHTMNVVRPIIDDVVMRGLSPIARQKLAEGLNVMRANLLQMERSRDTSPSLIGRSVESITDIE